MRNTYLALCGLGAACLGLSVLLRTLRNLKREEKARRETFARADNAIKETEQYLRGGGRIPASPPPKE